MFVPSQQKSQGPVAWAEKMIKESDYVIITWMSEIIPLTEGKVFLPFTENWKMNVKAVMVIYLR